MSLEVHNTGSEGSNKETSIYDNHLENKYDISIKALRHETKNKISALLNPYKVIPSDNGLPRDWQGFAELIGLTGEQLPQLEAERDPTSKLFIFWQKKEKEKCTVKKLLQFFEKLDRFDIIDDIRTLIDVDIKVFQENKNELLPSNASLEIDRLILTVDDVNRVNQGLKPQQYDAFVLYADEDIDFATQLLETMEKQYNLKLCVKDRDLVGGAFEHDVVIKLISERCNRLVVIITAAFLKSFANTFFLSFAQAISIEQRQRKIIPCLYGSCTVPPELRCYFMLDYRRSGKLWNFWEKLRDSIQIPKDVPLQLRSNNRTFQRLLSDQPYNKPPLFSTDNHLRSSLHDRKVRPPRTIVKFRSLVDLKAAEEEESIKPDPALNVSPSSSSLSAMNSSNTDGLKSNKTKTSWLKKLLSNKGDKKSEKNEKKEKKIEKVEAKNEKVKKGEKSKDKLGGNNVIEKVHHKSKKHFWTMPTKRKVAIMN